MKRVALKSFYSCQFRQRWAAQLAGGSNQQRCLQLAAVDETDVPERGGLVVFGVLHFSAELDMRG